MEARWFYRASVVGLFLFSLVALATMLTAVTPILVTGHIPPPAQDEGTQAHIFQLSTAALLPFGVVFVATVDWGRPLRVAKAAAIPVAAVSAAFTLLYHFEHLT